MQIPAKIKIGFTICSGAVYYFADTDKFTSQEPHYFVILNSNPLDSTSLVVVNATSKIDKREAFIGSRGLPPETLVKVTPKECSFLKINSIFDCNSANSYTPQKLIELCESGVFRYKGVISTAILSKLKTGLIASPLIKKELKKLV